MKPCILLVDDEPATLFGFSRYLEKVGYDVEKAACLSEAREIIAARRFDAVILDMMLPDGNGVDWICDLRNDHPDIAIVVITGRGDIPRAVEAMHRGADNFLTKPVSLTDLDVFLRKSLELGSLRRRKITEERLTPKVQPYFGESPAMKKVMELASMAAENRSTVLVQGETGSGKGVLARWIYENAPGNTGPFVEINCSGLRGDLLASELFGHARGAFTSAVQEKQGLIEVADGGTLFLDEIADMDPEVQPQFLKVIEEKRYRRVGDIKTRKSDFRLIAATNRDLAAETRAGRFRKDLFFRINVVPISIPPLRERLEDLPGLVKIFMTSFRSPHSEIPPEVVSLLKSYPWPGNIRELRNVLERALLIARGDVLSPEHFPGLEPDLSSEPVSSGLDHLEERHIKAKLESNGGDIGKAAGEMGISRATLYRKLKKFRERL